MSAPERIPARSVTATDPAVTALLARGELTVRGRIREASNTVLYCTVALEGREAACVYKPVAGERPLWDFPDGDLARREVATYAVSEATGWGLVPPTVLRDGPHGEGMCQLWIEQGPGEEEGDLGADGLLALLDAEEPGEGWKAIGFAEVGEGRTALLVHADDERLRRLAVLDAVVNNSDRKGGHLLPTADGRLYGIDHGVTFHVENKLRTLLWGWAGEPLTGEAVDVLKTLGAALEPDGHLARTLADLVTPAELDATRARVETLLASGRHPLPGTEWPAIPWPPV
ncbi:SCO1664 family protein [Streptomyces sp. NPDC091281]|uniref:SCO1664 family protein n=1 Tax=Streptomyces sp. NPDC091281 TaxID=3365985 RepID=UPI003801350E